MADISKLDDISKLQTYEEYIAYNITEWEARAWNMERSDGK